MRRLLSGRKQATLVAALALVAGLLLSMGSMGTLAAREEAVAGIATHGDAIEPSGNPMASTHGTVPAQTVVPGGSLASDTTWSLDGSPYLVLGDLRVDGGRTLTVEPGVMVMFEPDSDDQRSGWWDNKVELIIDGGHLIAEGTPENPIVFSSSNFPAMLRDWGMIAFYGDATGTLRQCEISGAFNGVHASGPDTVVVVESCAFSANEIGIHVQDRSPATILGNTITGSARHGIEVRDAPAEISNNSIRDTSESAIFVGAWDPSNRSTLVGNEISENRQVGIYMENYGASSIAENTITNNAGHGIEYYAWDDLGPAVPVITGNRIVGNGDVGIRLGGAYSGATINNNSIMDNGGGYDLENSSRLDIDARFNYWGVASTQEMDGGGNPKNISRIYDIHDDESRGMVNYSGWLDREGGTPTSIGTTGSVELTDPNHIPVGFYESTATDVYVELVDGDLNGAPGTADTTTVWITSNTESASTGGEEALALSPEGAREILTLTETGPDTGVFRGTIPLSFGGGVGEDGVLAASVGDSIWVIYEDAADDWGNPATIEETVRVVRTLVSGGVWMRTPSGP